MTAIALKKNTTDQIACIVIQPRVISRSIGPLRFHFRTLLTCENLPVQSPLLKPNSITIAGSEWFEAGSELVRSWFEAAAS